MALVSFLDDSNIRQDIGADYAVIDEKGIFIVVQSVIFLQIIKVLRISPLYRIAIGYAARNGVFETFSLSSCGAV